MSLTTNLAITAFAGLTGFTQTPAQSDSLYINGQNMGYDDQSAHETFDNNSGVRPSLADLLGTGNNPLQPDSRQLQNSENFSYAAVNSPYPSAFSYQPANVLTITTDIPNTVRSPISQYSTAWISNDSGIVTQDADNAFTLASWGDQLARAQDNQNSSPPAVKQLPQTRWEPDGKSLPDEFNWIVMAGAIMGTFLGFMLRGRYGALVGGALLATSMVPVRQHYAAQLDPTFFAHNLGLGAEMASTLGFNFMLGLGIIAMGGGADFLSKRIKSFFTKKNGADEELKKKLAEMSYSDLIDAFGAYPAHKVLRALYTKPKTQVVLRLAVGALALYDMMTDANGNFKPQGILHDNKGNISVTNLQIDHWWGFAAAIYSGNALFSRAFGANLFGLDIAAPFSVASYKAFRWMAGEGLWDYDKFNYNEALYWRYIAETGNVLTNCATYGRMYMRPDLRMQIATERGFAASAETGTLKPAPALWLLDNTLGWLYRTAPNLLRWKGFIRPLTGYNPGESMLPRFAADPLAAKAPDMAERFTVISGFKGNDMMKPEFGSVGGRVMNLIYSWGVNIPLWAGSSSLVGMNWKEWGTNRWIKQGVWPIWGAPLKAGLGGDTMSAQAGGFGVGLGIDAGATLMANGRYKGRHWSRDFHDSLHSFSAATKEEERNNIADHVLDDIFDRQMTDWSYSNARVFESYYNFNPDYLGTFVREEEKLSPEERKALEAIYDNRMRAFQNGELSGREAMGMAHLKKVLDRPRANAPAKM